MPLNLSTLWRINGRQPLPQGIGGLDFAARLQSITVHLQESFFSNIPDQQLLEMGCGFEDDITIRDLEQQAGVQHPLDGDTTLGFDPAVPADSSRTLPACKIIRVFLRCPTGREQLPDTLFQHNGQWTCGAL